MISFFVFFFCFFLFLFFPPLLFRVRRFSRQAWRTSGFVFRNVVHVSYVQYLDTVPMQLYAVHVVTRDLEHDAVAMRISTHVQSTASTYLPTLYSAPIRLRKRS